MVFRFFPGLPNCNKTKSTKYEKTRITVKVLVPQSLQLQGSHRLEKYLNIKDSLEKSLKIKLP